MCNDHIKTFISHLRLLNIILSILYSEYGGGRLHFILGPCPSGSAVKGVGLGRFVAGISGSNPVRGMDVYLCVYMLCCPVSVVALQPANYSSNRVLLRV
jgi:hypothetical protein